MSLHHKTFVKLVTLQQAKPEAELITQAFAEIDHAFDEFTKEQHWSQGRDAFQSVTVVSPTLMVISRTFVYTDEQLATAMPGGARTARPPV